MPKKKVISPKINNSGPINLPIRTLFLIGVLLALVGITMILFPNYWFGSICK